MKKTSCIFFAVIFLLHVSAQSDLTFIENKGQINDSNILFSLKSGSGYLFLTRTGLKYQFIQSIEPEKRTIKTSENPFIVQPKLKTETFEMELVNCNPDLQIETEGNTGYYENFYLSNCPQGITKVPSYKKIRYKNIYPNIDWEVYINSNSVKHDFIVHPGGQVKDIQMKYHGTQGIAVGSRGELHIAGILGNVTEQKPYTYSSGSHQIIGSSFIMDNNHIGFEIEPYDPGATIIIDPVIVWSTYYGTSDYDDTHAGVIADGSGNIYFGGNTSSSTGISLNGFQDTSSCSGCVDAYLVKMDENGNRKWATYYGGDGIDVFYDIAANGNNLYTAGTTNSNNVIAYNGFQNIIGADTSFISGYTDAMLIKFDTSGLRIWGTYLGNDNEEQGYGVICDDIGNVFFAGYTQSGMPLTTFNGFQTTYGGGSFDGFIAQFNSSGTLGWISYYGGSGDDECLKLALDTSQNSLYFIGYTNSSSGISFNGFQNSIGGNYDAMIAKFNVNGSRVWASYYGGTGAEIGMDIAVDASDHVYTAMSTTSNTGVASMGQITTITGSTDDLILKMDASGTRVWSSYFPAGDNALMLGNGIGISSDPLSNVYLTGCTSEAVGLACSGFQNFYGGGTTDSYVTKFNSSGTIEWASYLGGDGNETSTGCAYSLNTDHVYVCGYTSSTSNIALNGYLNTNSGITVGYITSMTTDGNCNFAVPIEDPISLSIYPNPTEGRITIQTEGEISYSIMNAIGQLIYSGKTTNTLFSIDLTPFPKGIYILTFGTNGYKKIIKY